MRFLANWNRNLMVVTAAAAVVVTVGVTVVAMNKAVILMNSGAQFNGSGGGHRGGDGAVDTIVEAVMVMEVAVVEGGNGGLSIKIFGDGRCAVVSSDFRDSKLRVLAL
ncbi:hypothetical protein Bca4012_011743 [Brassica carinata]|uniref:Uncharacterized protein n=1 Tax=Brassica carinata TaxID=52824 RepID=A0A8X7S580_BRACI|nr:hypothetical protein Bca52824_036614 [Brassica carinata]